MRRAAPLAILVAVVLAVAGTPASAHGGDAPDATAYRSTVSGIVPAEAGLTVRTVEAGARLELINRTGRTIEVLGYAGEPYLEIRPDGTFTNVNSPAAYRNATLRGDTAVPATADPTAPPQWRRESRDPTVRWHDLRALWTGDSPPAAAAADPDGIHRLRDWAVPLRDGVRVFEVRGTLDWVPPPASGLWWMATLLVAALAVPLHRRRVPLAGAALVAAATTVGYAMAREVDAGARGVGPVLTGLLGGQLTAVVAAAGALAAAGLLLARRPLADFASALAGAGLVIFAGLANTAVFAQSVAPAPGPSWWPRVAVLITLGGGAALAAAGMLRLRAAEGRTTAWRLREAVVAPDADVSGDRPM